MTDFATGHSGGKDCPVCGDGHSGVSCCHSRYSARMRRFIVRHRTEYLTAHLAPDRRSSSNVLERLAREFQTLPPRHDCWCVCKSEDLSRGYPACHECVRLRRAEKLQEAVEIGRTGAVNAPMPSTIGLDLAAGLL